MGDEVEVEVSSALARVGEGVSNVVASRTIENNIEINLRIFKTFSPV
jgi:hypothetical protein